MKKPDYTIREAQNEVNICGVLKEKNLKKGDKIILTAFGEGFVFGSAYLKWAYDTKD